MRVENNSCHLEMSTQEDREVMRVFEYGLDVLAHLGQTRQNDTAASTESFVRGVNKAVTRGAGLRVAFDTGSKPTLMRALNAAFEHPELTDLPHGNVAERNIHIGEAQFILP